MATRWTEEDLARVAFRVKRDHEQREDRPESLPLKTNNWRPRPRPKTAIISEAAGTVVAREEKRGTWPPGLQHVHRPKYSNTATMINGLRFDSKLEADRYRELVAMEYAGVVRWFIRRPRFDLPGSVVYEADFLVVWNRDNPVEPMVVTVEDCKGVETAVFKIKKRQMAECYPNVSLRLLTRKDVRRA